MRTFAASATNGRFLPEASKGRLSRKGLPTVGHVDAVSPLQGVDCRPTKPRPWHRSMGRKQPSGRTPGGRAILRHASRKWPFTGCARKTHDKASIPKGPGIFRELGRSPGSEGGLAAARVRLTCARPISASCCHAWMPQGRMPGGGSGGFLLPCRAGGAWQRSPGRRRKVQAPWPFGPSALPPGAA